MHSNNGPDRHPLAIRSIQAASKHLQHTCRPPDVQGKVAGKRVVIEEQALKRIKEKQVAVVSVQ